MALSPSRTPFAHSVAEDPVRGPGVPVLVVTTDDGLWVRLSAALPGLALEQFDDPADVIERWNAARGAVVLVDARTAGDLARTIERIQTHSVALVPVALVDDETLPAAVALERQRALFDHVSLTLDPGSTLAAIERAGEEAMARVALVPPGVSPSVSRAPRRRGAGGRSTALIAGGGVAALAIAAAAWWYTHSGEAPAPAAAPAAANGPAVAPAGDAPATAAAPATPDANASAEDATASAAIEVENLLARARTAMRDKRYIDPDSDNALAYYKGVLAYDAENGEARQGLDRIAELLIGRAESALTGRDYNGTLRALEVARSLKADHPKLAALDAQLSQRIQDLALAQIQAAVQANAFDRASALIRQAERNGAVPAVQLAQLRLDIARRESSSAAAELVRVAQARLTQGRLLEPANDNAKYYLAQLAARGDSADALARLRTDYVRRVTAETRAAIAKGADAEAWLAELRANGATAAQIAALQREPAQAQQQTKVSETGRYASAAQDRLAARRLLAPENDNAVYWFRTLQAADPRHPALPALRDAIGTALVDQARAAYDGNRAAEAQAALDLAREFGVPASTIAGVQSAGTAPRAPVAATLPKLLRALNPQYPSRAATAGQQGWVEVQFVVTAEGTTDEVRVGKSEPAGVFDAAAVAAVRRARFEPARTADGTPMAMNSNLRVRFTLEQKQ